MSLLVADKSPVTFPTRKERPAVEEIKGIPPPKPRQEGVGAYLGGEQWSEEKEGEQAWGRSGRVGLETHRSSSSSEMFNS